MRKPFIYITSMALVFLMSGLNNLAAQPISQDRLDFSSLIFQPDGDQLGENYRAMVYG